MLPNLTLRNTPKVVSSGSHSSAGDSIPRPRSSTNYSLVTVTNTALPPTPTSASPARPASATGYTIPGISSSFSASALSSLSERPSGRPQTIIGTSSFGGDAALRGFGNVPGPNPSKAESGGVSNTIKRSSTAFSMSSSMGRVISGTRHVGSPTDIVSTTSPVGGASGSTTSTSVNGRLKKITADLWLLSGRLQEAISCYMECLSAFKGQNDNIWHASACEGLATANLLEAWETRNPEHGNLPLLSSPVLSGAYDLLVQAQTLYEKSVCPPESLFLHGAESGESVIARLYTFCSLRTAKLLLYSWSAGGFGAASLQSIITGRMPRSYPPKDYAHRRRVFLKLTTMSKISRALITRTGMKAHGPWLTLLSEAVQLDVMVDLANMQRILGFDRKEMFIDRELYGLGISTIVASVPPQRHNDRSNRSRSDSTLSRRSDDSSMTEDTDIEVSVSLREDVTSGPIPTSAAGFVAAKRPDNDESTDAIIGLTERTLHVLGMDLALSLEPPGADVMPQFGWPELQVEAIRDAVTAAEALTGQSCFC
jgi:hypothetical protein